MSMLTSYGDVNFILVGDYNYRCNQIECGQPEVAVELSGSTPIITIAQWWRAAIQETASFKYVGMDYDTAQRCASEMRSRFTINTYPWIYGEYLSSVGSGASMKIYMLYGWHKGAPTPTLESEVRLEKRTGAMYDVVVDAKCTTYNYDKAANALDLANRPLYTALTGTAGWDNSHTLSGEHFDSASGDNITIVVAPTQTVEFELIAEQLVTSKPDNLSSFDVSNWYRATTDSYAQVRYEGMTKAACRSLYSSLNSTNGWYLSSHPWEYGVSSDGGRYVLGWHQKTDVTQYQCLNEYRAYEGDSGLFTVELTLHAQTIGMTASPSYYTPPSYPSIWSSKVPGLASYL